MPRYRSQSTPAEPVANPLYASWAKAASDSDIRFKPYISDDDNKAWVLYVLNDRIDTLPGIVELEREDYLGLGMVFKWWTKRIYEPPTKDDVFSSDFVYQDKPLIAYANSVISWAKTTPGMHALDLAYMPGAICEFENAILFGTPNYKPERQEQPKSTYEFEFAPIEREHVERIQQTNQSARFIGASINFD